MASILEISEISLLNFNVSLPEHELLFANSLNECFSKDKYLDVVFVCSDNVCIRTHKVLLINISEFLKRIIYENTNDTLYISIPEVHSKTMEKFIYFLYEGTTKVNLQDLLNLKDLMTFLGVRLTNFDVKSVGSEEDVPSNDFRHKNHDDDKCYKPAVLKPYSIDCPSNKENEPVIREEAPSQKLLASMPHAALTEDQIMALEEIYKNNKYPSKESYINLAKELKISFRQVYVWFHDKRSKEKTALSHTKPVEGEDNVVKKKKKPLSKVQESSVKGTKQPVKKFQKELAPFLKFSADAVPDTHQEEPPVIIDNDFQRVLAATPSGKLSKEHISMLEKVYEYNQIPSRQACVIMAKEHDIPFRQVYTWFLRKRRKEQADLLQEQGFEVYTRWQDETGEAHEVVDVKKEVIACEICGKMFSTIQYLRIHNIKYKNQCKRLFLKRNSKKNKKISSKLDFSTAPKTENNEKGIFPCETCGRAFSTIQYLKIHNIKYNKKCKHASLKCDKKSKSNIRDASSKPKDIPEKNANQDKQYVCIICDAKFCLKEDITRHIIQAHKEKIK